MRPLMTAVRAITRISIIKGVPVNRIYSIILIFFALTSCATIIPTVYTPYTPNPINVTDPISVIRNTIQQQPPAYAYTPAYLEVDDQCIKLFMESYSTNLLPIIGGGGGIIVGPGSTNLSPELVCYRNIGRIGLFHIEMKNLWRVEIDDKGGNYMYWVYTYERSDAERFIDAIYNFVTLKNQVP